MKRISSVTTAPAVLDLMLRRRIRRSVHLGHGFFGFGNYVVAITGPTQSRMPNGVQLPLDVDEPLGAPCLVGRGLLRLPDLCVRPGPLWSPRPTVAYVPRLQTDSSWIGPDLVGWGPGLTPLGDDVLIGYLAGLALFARTPTETWRIPRNRTHRLAATLLSHARSGELPEPAHDLLAHGEMEPLLAFGETSGRAILVGLAAAATHLDVPTGLLPVAEIEVDLPLPRGTRAMVVSVHETAEAHVSSTAAPVT